MHNLVLITEILIALLVVLLAIYDLIILWLEGNQAATISEVIWAKSKIYPAIPFFFGLLMGHFFTLSF